MNAQTACPKCGSTEIHFRQSRNDWVCDVCEHHWVPEAPTKADGSTRAKARLFLSYGRRDASDLADRLRTDLERQGYEIWQDTRRIRSGKEWEQEILEGLRNTQLLLAVLSPHSVRVTGDPENPDDLDSVCLDEISFARFSRPPKPVVPIMALTCEPPLSIYRLNYIDMRGALESHEQYHNAFTQLLEAIKAGLHGEVQYRSWDHQLRPWDFSAFLNEKRQHFCGREWLFDEIEQWRTQSQGKALLIVGDPGTGKSAIVAELVHQNREGQVLAYHCCQADTKETLQPGRFVRNLAAMIASKIEAYADRLSDPTVEEALSEANCARDPASAFEAGILTPLDDVQAPAGGARYLLVDALDEALAFTDASRTTIVDVLASRLDRLPTWLRLVATSRRERGVLDRFRGVRILELVAHDPRNLDDIGRYIAQRLKSPLLQERLAKSGLSAEQAALTLRQKADGNILYVIRALEGIERDLYGFDNLEALPPGLYGLYLGFFNRHFPDEASFAPVRTVLEVVVAARSPLKEERIAQATGLDRDAELPRVLRRLSAYLHEQNGHYAVYHKSFADWLTAADTRGSLHHISLKRGHERLADLFWKEYKRGPQTLSNYGLTHLSAHLTEAGRWDDLATLLCDLSFIEAKAMAGLVYQLQGDYDAALDAWPGYENYDAFEREGNPAPVAWLTESTAAIRAGAAEAHPDKGTGPLLTKLRALPEEQRNPEPQAPLFPLGRALSEPAGEESKTVAAIRLMEQTEKATASGMDPYASDTPAGRVQAFANFVTTNGHMLASIPHETMTLARNHAGTGIVAERAEAHTKPRTRPWLSRDPRPPALPARPACLRTLEGHTNRVNTVVLAPDGRTAVSAGSDSVLRVWDIVSGICLRTLDGHRRSVRGVALAADGRTAVSCSHDSMLRVWDITTGESKKTLKGHTDWVNSVALTPDGSLAISCSNDRTIRIWDLAEGKCLRQLGGHQDEIRSVAISEDGRLAVSTGNDATVRVWDVATGQCLRVMRGHTDHINSVNMTPDGRLAVTASRDRTVRIWDIASGQCLRSLEGFDNWVNAGAITPDGRVVVTAGFDLSLRVWDVVRGVCLRQLPGHTAWVSDVTVTPDARLALSAGSDHTIRIWDLTSGECTRSLPSHSAWVSPVILTPDRTKAISPSRDHTLRIWDAATGRTLHTLTGHGNWVNCVAVTPDGGTAISASSDSKMKVWDVESGNCLHTLGDHTDWVHYIAITPDGSTAVSGSSDATVRVWDIATGKCLRTLTGHTDWITFVALTPDGRVAITAGRDHSVRFWDLTTGESLHVATGHRDYIEGIAVTADGRLAISAGIDRVGRVWRVLSGTCRAQLEGHEADIENVAVTPDGRFAITPSRDYTLRVWDLSNGNCLRVLRGHIYGVTGVVITPDGQFAVSTSWDNTVRVWVIGTGECVAVYHAGARVAYAAVDVDGRIVCGSGDGQVHFLQLRNVTMGLPLVTAVRLYYFGKKEAPAWARWIPGLRGALASGPGYDSELTALCPACGKRFPAPAKVVDTITGILRTTTLHPRQSIAIRLPATAWNEPGLESACPNCKWSVRFNPYFVDSSKS